MKNQKNSFFASLASCSKKQCLIVIQFFFIIFIYHTLKDLKDTLVITASDAGAEVIPFIKIWAMLPFAFGASYLFWRIYHRFGREKTLYFFVSSLLIFYLVFAFILYPFREALYLNNLDWFLKAILPAGCKGFISMLSYWHYTLFYLAAELWSLLIMSVLFWGFVNDTTALDEAKQFYPMCMFFGNFACILSGQTSHYLCHHLIEYISWENTLQLMIFMVAGCGIVIMSISFYLERQVKETTVNFKEKSNTPRKTLSFLENLSCVFRSGPLACIAILVIGFGLTSNLIEVIWKENIKNLYPAPQDYNAYINQLTSLIGTLAVIMALVSRWIFKVLSWSSVAIITPITLFTTCFFFFSALLLPEAYLSPLASWLNMTTLSLIVALGSIHYVLALTAKYTLFDTTKEMAFLSIEPEERLRAKSVIDSVGSRLGKSGSSCLYQFLLIVFGSTAGHVSLIGIASVLMIGISIFTTRKLGGYLSSEVKDQKMHQPLEAELA